VAEDASGSLTLGWQVNATLDPRYWLDPAARPGRQAASDLLRVPASALANHTAIIAQSGSGKSFLLGRLIEEILLESRGRCVIIDPNSDFRRVYESQNSRLWTEARYDTLSRSGRLPHEASREQFTRRWSRIPVRIRTGSARRFRHAERLKLWWPSISVEFLAEELDPMLRSDLYHIHAFVKALEPLVLLKQVDNRPVDLIEEAERLFRQGRQRSEDEFRKDLEREFNIRELRNRYRQMYEVKPGQGVRPFFLVPFWFHRMLVPEFNSRIRGLQKAPKYVSEVVERFYFGKAREYMAAGILETEPQPGRFSRSMRLGHGSKRFSSGFRRLEVVDLPSLPDSRQHSDWGGMGTCSGKVVIGSRVPTRGRYEGADVYRRRRGSQPDPR